MADKRRHILLRWFSAIGHIFVVCWLIGANIVPLYGVLKWDWAVQEIMFLFAAETVTIAFFGLAVMLTTWIPHDETVGEFASAIATFGGAIGLASATIASIVFFGEAFDLKPMALAFSWESGLGTAVSAMMVAYLLRFVFDWVLSGKFMRSGGDSEMVKTVFRILFTAFFGVISGGLITLFKQPIIPLVILCICKLLWDVLGYLIRISDDLPKGDMPGEERPQLD